MAQFESASFSFVRGDSPDPDLRRHIQRLLRSYNQQVSSIQDPEPKAFNVTVRNSAGVIVGGIMTRLYWNWLVIDLFALEDEVRGQGFGKQLLRQAEDEARQHGCTRAHTSTYGFQALAFYQHFGYRIVGQLNDYPDGMTFYWPRKELQP
jgi:GNAT superfamily N-acetyltransferase